MNDHHIDKSLFTSRHLIGDGLVQCAANYQASAMTYLYRVVVEKDLYAVWNPGEVSQKWDNYIEGVLAVNLATLHGKGLRRRLYSM